MKMYKKYLGIMSGIALSLSLVACGPQDDANESGDTSNEDKPKELLVWEDVLKGDGIKDAISKFEEEHDVKVTMVEKQYTKQIEDLRLDGPAGTGADVLTMPSDQTGTAVTEGLLKELTVDEATQGIYTEAAMAAQKVNGKVYGLPKAVETSVIYYNKDLISEEEVPTSLDGWYEYSKSVTDGENFGFLALFDQIYYANSVLSGYGGYIFGQDSDGNYDTLDLGINTAGAIEGAEYIQKFYKEGLFPSGIIGEQGISVVESLFTEGKAAAILSGPWNIEPFTKAGVNYGIQKLPELSNGENMTAFIGVKSYNVSSYSKNPELAEEFVKFIANEENSKKRYEITQEVPAVAALANDPVVTESEVAKAVAEQSKFSVLMPNIPEMNEVWTPTDSALQTIATGKSEPKAALDQAVETITGQIQAKHK